MKPKLNFKISEKYSALEAFVDDWYYQITPNEQMFRLYIIKGIGCLEYRQGLDCIDLNQALQAANMHYRRRVLVKKK